jgi:hypothetical protein
MSLKNKHNIGARLELSTKNADSQTETTKILRPQQSIQFKAGAIKAVRLSSRNYASL